MEIPIEEFKKLKHQVSSIEDKLSDVHNAIVGNPLSKDGGLATRLSQAEQEILDIKEHVDEMEKKQIRDLLESKAERASSDTYVKIMWGALSATAALILAYILK